MTDRSKDEIIAKLTTQNELLKKNRQMSDNDLVDAKLGFRKDEEKWKKEREEYEKKIADYKNTVATLQREKDKLRQEKHELRHEAREQSNRADRFEASAGQYLIEAATLRHANYTLRNEFNALQIEKDKVDLEVARLKSENDLRILRCTETFNTRAPENDELSTGGEKRARGS